MAFFVQKSDSDTRPNPPWEPVHVAVVMPDPESGERSVLVSLPATFLFRCLESYYEDLMRRVQDNMVRRGEVEQALSFSISVPNKACQLRLDNVHVNVYLHAPVPPQFDQLVPFYVKFNFYRRYFEEFNQRYVAGAVPLGELFQLRMSTLELPPADYIALIDLVFVNRRRMDTEPTVPTPRDFTSREL